MYDIIFMQADECRILRAEVSSSLLKILKCFEFCMWKSVNKLFAYIPGFDDGRARVASASNSVILLGRDGRRLERVGDGINRSESEGNGWSNGARKVLNSKSGALMIISREFGGLSIGALTLIRSRALLPVRCRVLRLKSPA